MSPGTRLGTYEMVESNNSPQWLPDGQRLLIARRGRLFVADWPSGATREVFAIPGENISQARLSPDGRFVYFLHGSSSGDIWSVRFDAAH